ncbi:hypothetical protein TKK_0011850 [Trichogramma kaykai]
MTSERKQRPAAKGLKTQQQKLNAISAIRSAAKDLDGTRQLSAEFCTDQFFTSGYFDVKGSQNGFQLDNSHESQNNSNQNLLSCSVNRQSINRNRFEFARLTPLPTDSTKLKRE